MTSDLQIETCSMKLISERYVLLVMKCKLIKEERIELLTATLKSWSGLFLVRHPQWCFTKKPPNNVEDRK